MHRARQPEGTALEIPDDNTTRQAQALDHLLAARQETPAPPDVQLIEVELFGSWVQIPVKVASLRRALGLPPHDIFTAGIFHGFTPTVAQPTGHDVNNVDHADELGPHAETEEDAFVDDALV